MLLARTSTSLAGVPGLPAAAAALAKVVFGSPEVETTEAARSSLGAGAGTGAGASAGARTLVLEQVHFKLQVVR